MNERTNEQTPELFGQLYNEMTALENTTQTVGQKIAKPFQLLWK